MNVQTLKNKKCFLLQHLEMLSVLSVQYFLWSSHLNDCFETLFLVLEKAIY